MTNKKTSNTIALIGCGNVGASFMYSALNQGIAEEYQLLDLNKEQAEGQAMDFQDAARFTPFPAHFSAIDYSDLKDTDVIVITAGRPLREGETRIDMIADNSKIMKSIAEQVKASGFNGVTIIAANPVDVMTKVYQVVTGFSPSKVISSGTSLDSGRLQEEIGRQLEVSADSVNAWVLGEHGDTSVSAVCNGYVTGNEILHVWGEKGLDLNFLKETGIDTFVREKAYEIAKRKGSTFYGIGAALAKITRAVLRDEKIAFAVGANLEGHYGIEYDIYFGTPCILGRNGISQIIEVQELSEEAKRGVERSAKVLNEATKIALDAIK